MKFLSVVSPSPAIYHIQLPIIGYMDFVLKRHAILNFK